LLFKREKKKTSEILVKKEKRKQSGSVNDFIYQAELTLIFSSKHTRLINNNLGANLLSSFIFWEAKSSSWVLHNLEFCSSDFVSSMN